MKKRLFFFIILIITGMSCHATKTVENVLLNRIFVVDNAGCIYTNLDRHTIIKHSPEGKELLRLGKPGEGPGDIKRLGMIAINPITSQLYITEGFGGNKWISRFSLEGQFKGAWDFEIDQKKWRSLGKIDFDAEGNIYLEAQNTKWKTLKNFRVGNIDSIIKKYSPKGKLLKDIYRFNVDFMAENGNKGNITIPFQNHLAWHIGNGHIFFRENYDPFISVFSLEGAPIKKLSLPYKSSEVTKKDLITWEKSIKEAPNLKKGIAEGWFDLNFWKSNLPFPKFKSLSAGIMFVDSDGHLYSGKYPEKGLTHVDTWAKINILSGKNSLVGMHPKGTLLFAKNGDYYFAIVDDEDERVLVIVSEKELRLKQTKKEYLR